MKNLVVVFCLLCNWVLNAQTAKVAGTVTFQGEPVPETFITVKTNQVYNTTTNDEGYFSVDIPENVTQYTITWEHAQFKVETRSFTYVEGQNFVCLLTKNKMKC